MDGNTKIKVTSRVNGIVSLSLSSRSFKREWRAKNQAVLIPFEVLEEAIYDPGFINMINQGILTIDSMEACVELGLEPDGATKPVNHPVYDDTELRRLLNVATVNDFEEHLQKMPDEAKRSLAEMAIALKVRDGNKMALIQKYQNIDVNKAMLLDMAMEN